MTRRRIRISPECSEPAKQLVCCRWYGVPWCGGKDEGKPHYKIGRMPRHAPFWQRSGARAQSASLVMPYSSQGSFLSRLKRRLRGC